MCEYIIYSVEHEYVSLETFTGICSIFVNFAFPLNQFDFIESTEYKNEGEFNFLSKKISAHGFGDIRLLAIPRTLYELLYLKVETEFFEMDVKENYENGFEFCLCPTFFINHFSRLQIEDIKLSVSKVLETKMYQQLIWNLNNSIVSILRLLSKDLIISKTLLLQLTSSLVDQLKEMEFNYSSDLSKSYKNWPLSSPLYLYERENLLTESYSEEELESVATNVLNDIYSLRNAGYDKRLIFKKFTEIKKIYSENVVYKKFLDIFSPNLKDLFVLSSLEDFNDMNVELLKQFVSIFERVDVGVESFMKKDFMDKEMLQKVILYEYDISKENCVCLYRASSDISADNTTRESEQHSLSFSLSLFSGVLHDKTATVYTKLKTGFDCRLYAIKLNLSDLADQESETNKTFFIPPIPSLLQISGIGEFFHCRTKVQLGDEESESKDKFISGILNCSYSRIPLFLKTSSQYFKSFKEKATIFV